jgi:glycosyltransferase involved in cell wall biosynthesis
MEITPDEPDPIDVTVVVCTRNRSAIVDRCLASIESVEGIDSSGGPVEVLVVDNGSSDATPDVIGRWRTRLPVLRSVDAPVAGLSRARNVALREARGHVVAFLDDDVLVDRGWLVALRSAYAVDPPVVGTAGRIELAWPGGRPRWLPESREVWFAALDLGESPRLLRDRERPVGANMSVVREVALDVGGFDPTLGYSGRGLLGNEELDFFDRIRAWGGVLAYAPGASVMHVVEGDRVSRRYLVRRVYSQGRSDVRLLMTAGATGRRALLGLARRSAARASVRGWRHDIGRITRPGNRGREIVDIVVGRAKQAGMAREAVTVAVRRSARR